MKNRSLVWVIGILIIGVAVLAFINKNSLANKNQSPDNPSILVKAGSKEMGSIDLAKIKTLGEERFTAVLRPSGKAPQSHEYRGVRLANVLKAVDPQILEGSKKITVRAADGYTAAFAPSEVLDEGNIYLVYLQDDKPLGTKKDGGSGPFMIVVRKDEFGQRWCKFVAEVVVE